MLLASVWDGCPAQAPESPDEPGLTNTGGGDMGHVAVTRTLVASPAAAWSVVVDPRTWGDWFTVHDRWLNRLPASLAEGTGLAAKVVMLGVATRIAWTVESAAAPARLVLAGTGPAGLAVRCVFVLAPAGTGSRFTFIGDLEGTLLRGALVKAVELDCTKQVEASLVLLDALAAPPRMCARASADPVRPKLRLVYSAPRN